MPLDPSTDLTKFQGHKVIVQVNLDTPNEKGELTIEIEGSAEAANALGVLLKPKGKTQVELIEVTKIEGIEFAPEKPKTLSAKAQPLVEFGKARAHLLSYHLYTVEAVNQMTEAEALNVHEGINHTDPHKLGHVHKAVEPKSDREKAIEQAPAQEAPVEEQVAEAV